MTLNWIINQTEDITVNFTVEFLERADINVKFYNKDLDYNKSHGLIYKIDSDINELEKIINNHQWGFVCVIGFKHSIDSNLPRLKSICNYIEYMPFDVNSFTRNLKYFDLR